MDILDRLHQFAGTHLRASVTGAEATVNELLRMSPAPLSGAVAELAPGNRIVVRYGVLHATARIEAFQPGPAPRLRLSLASLVVAVAVRAAVRQPSVRVSGREVTVDLAAVPALVPYAAIWPHLRRLDIATSAGRVTIDVEIAVME